MTSLDLDSEDGRIVIALAAIGAMVAGCTPEQAAQAQHEIPEAVRRFRFTYKYETVLGVLKRTVAHYLRRN